MALMSFTPTAYHAFETITVADTALGLPQTVATIPANAAVWILITVETAAVRFRLDGTNPTATVGHVLEPGDILTLTSQEQMDGFKVIRRDGISATIQVSYGS